MNSNKDLLCIIRAKLLKIDFYAGVWSILAYKKWSRAKRAV